MKATIVGRIIRVAKLCNSGTIEFTIDVKETKVNETTFTIGTQLSCMVKESLPHDAKTGKVCPIAVGDEVTMELEKHPSKGWGVASLLICRPTCTPVKVFLKDLEEELEKRNK